ncbi:MAG: RluA family pseudouridine synthase [Clostridia bacterium]|nr:RluA family pseudouridine synthase [Clostridia bacterium]
MNNNSNIIAAVAADEDIGKRADVFVSKAADVTRSAAAALIEKGAVSVNGKVCTKSLKISSGDRIEIEMPEPQICEVLPENIPLDVVYEDSDVIVINKPQGMVVHPAPGHTTGTLVSALMYHCGDSLSDINGVIRPGIVHRIDRDTSGLLAVAKNNKAHISLAAQLEDHTLSRVYYAVVCGHLDEKGTVDAPIDRHPQDRKKMAVIKGGRNAVTHYETVEELSQYTFAKMKLETGRTHQIRVHMAHIGHPIVGDPVYGRPTQFENHHPKLFAGQMLHAGELTFIHPTTKEVVTVKAPLPENFEEALRLLRNGVV